MKTLRAVPLTQMKETKPAKSDPVFESIRESLFEGTQAADLQGLVERYVRFHANLEGEWISGDMLLAELQLAIDYAKERALEEIEESNEIERKGGA